MVLGLIGLFLMVEWVQRGKEHALEFKASETVIKKTNSLGGVFINNYIDLLLGRFATRVYLFSILAMRRFLINTVKFGIFMVLIIMILVIGTAQYSRANFNFGIPEDRNILIFR